jgi:hypothetical protein
MSKTMSMLSKEKLIQIINDLPDQFTVEEFFEKIIFLQKVEIGLGQSKSGQVLSTKEAREKLKRWLLRS